MPDVPNLPRLAAVLHDAADYVSARLLTGGRIGAEVIPFNLQCPVMQNLLREIEALGLAESV